MSSTLWGQLPFDLLSKILKIEKDRLDEVAMNEWKLSIKDLNHEFIEACSWCSWRGGEHAWTEKEDPFLAPGATHGMGYLSDETNYPEHKCVFSGADTEETLFYVCAIATAWTHREERADSPA
jgi:hypothetical protein